MKNGDEQRSIWREKRDRGDEKTRETVMEDRKQVGEKERLNEE